MDPGFHPLAKEQQYHRSFRVWRRACLMLNYRAKSELEVYMVQGEFESYTPTPSFGKVDLQLILRPNDQTGSPAELAYLD